MRGAMDDILPIIVVFSMPLAIVLALVLALIIRMYLKHKVEMFDRKLGAQNQVGGQTQSEIAALRQELAQLRDTSTQYDVSIQHTLEELQQRISHIEGKLRSGPNAPMIETSEEPARLTRS